MSIETMEFGPLVVGFTDGVLRPRPWTVLQASWAAELSAGLPPGRILELCAGAGHIGQAASSLTGRALVQVDVDPHACGVARRNAGRNGLAARVDVRCGDLEVAVGGDDRFAMVLADPPYLPRDEVGDFPEDPVGAIDGGADGLDLLRRCLVVAGAHVADGGAVLLQTRGRDQVHGLLADLDAAGLRLVDVRAHDGRRAVALLRPLVRRAPDAADRARSADED
ncbi:methyltransferase [uncultured Cellulomonas sp.]|uniref:methyltransferase n=1 Tax=uncultured Cellulomonas sp. TaxID=189682 RepID=UPI0026263582|nr:methyltransferase [uncultured Cellulomonas sp.]